MKSLLVCREGPYPPRSGSPLRLWQHVNVLAAHGEVNVFSVGLREPDAAMPVAARWIHVGDEYPIRIASGLRRIRKIFRPRQFPVENDYVTAEINERLRAFVQEIGPDVVVLSHWKDAFPDALRGLPRVVVDAHNIESLLLGDKHVRKRSKLGRLLENWRFRRRERRLFRQAGVVWVTSEEDGRELERLDRKAARPRVIPNAVDVDRYAAVRDRSMPVPGALQHSAYTMGFIGLYAYPPNERAAILLMQRIFPKVASALGGEARLLLVGKTPTESMHAEARKDPRVVVTGTVEDTRPYLAALDVIVIALDEGGGTRLKILEAFAAGVPVVTTSKGVEGIRAVDGCEITIAETADDLADAAIALARDPVRRDAQIANALALVTNDYSWASVVRRLPQALPAP